MAEKRGFEAGATQDADLSPAVQEQIRRLGGELQPVEGPGPQVDTVVGRKVLNYALRRLLAVRWSVPRFVDRGDPIVNPIRFELQTFKKSQYGMGLHPYVSIALEERYQMFWFTALDAADPTDPAVYRVDQDGEDANARPPGTPLSTMLETLEPVTP